MKQQFVFIWRPGTKGIPHGIKVAVDMIPTFMKPNDTQKPVVLAKHDLKDDEHGMTIDELALRYPAPAQATRRTT